MSWRGTLLLALFATLALSVLLLTRGTRTLPANQPLLGFSREETEHIVITESGGVISLLKTNGFWTLEGDVADRADPRLVGALLETASGLVPLDTMSTRDLKGDVNLASLGLEKPKRSITFRSGGTRTLCLGVEGAAKGRLYARLESGSSVYLIPDEVAALAFRPAQEFRDRRLTALQAERLKEVSLTLNGGVGGTRQLKLRKGSRDWMIESPVAARADNGEVTKWLEGIVSAKIDRWMPEGTDAAACGLDIPRALLTLAQEGGDPVTLSVGSAVPGSPGLLYVRCSDRPGICCVGNLEPALAVTPTALRARRLKPVPYDSIDRIETGDEATLVVLTRKPGTEDWEIRGTPSPSVPGALVNAWFERLQQLTGGSFEPATPDRIRNRGLEHPVRVRLIAHLSENTAEEGAGEIVLAEYSFGIPGSSETALLEGGSSDLMILPAETADLVREPTAWGTPASSGSPVPSPAPSPSAAAR